MHPVYAVITEGRTMQGEPLPVLFDEYRSLIEALCRAREVLLASRMVRVERWLDYPNGARGVKARRGTGLEAEEVLVVFQANNPGARVGFDRSR